MNQDQFDKYQNDKGLESIAILARAILLDKVKFVNGRIVVDPFDDI